MKVTVVIRLYGGLRKICGQESVRLEIEKGKTLREVITKLAEKSYKLRNVLIDPELNDPGPNAVILLNGVSIGLLKGLDTVIDKASQVVLLPVTHGG